MILEDIKVKDLVIGEPVFDEIRDLKDASLKEIIGGAAFSYRDEVFSVETKAKVAKEDKDLATTLVGQNIAELRLGIKIYELIIENFAHYGKEMDILVWEQKKLKNELETYINMKEEFFQRVRQKRENPDYNRIRHINFDDEGVATEIE